MEDFVQSVSKQLGIDQGTAQNATASLLGFIKENVGGDTFSSLAEKLPGASALADTAPAAEAESGGGGLLGNIASMASSALGGQAGEGIELAGMLNKLGLDASQGTSLIGKLVEFIKDKAGDEVLSQITEKIPALKSVLG